MENIYEAIAAAFNTPADEFTATLKGADGAYLTDADLKSKVSDFLKTGLSKEKAAQHNRATREVFSKVGKLFKAAGFQNQDGLESDALISGAVEFFQAQASSNPGDPSALSEADLARLPAVKKLVGAAKSDAEKAAADIKASFEAKEQQFAKQGVIRDARAIIASQAAEKKVKLGDGDARNKRLALLEKAIDFDSVGYDSEGRLVVMEDGAPKTSGFGKVVLFADTLPEHFDIFGYDASTGAGANPPSGSGSGNGRQAGANIIFATQAAFDSAYSTETDGTRRLEMMKSWQAQQEKK